MNSSAQDDDEKPLDPAAQRIVAKVRMLMLIAGATMLIGVGAIFAVIGYRVFKSEGSTPAASAAVPDVTANLPRGSRIVSTETSDDRIIVTIEVGGATEIRLFDLETLQPAGRLRLQVTP
jgi:hypothetical protein